MLNTSSDIRCQYQDPWSAIPRHAQVQTSKTLMSKSMGNALWRIRGVILASGMLSCCHHVLLFHVHKLLLLHAPCYVKFVMSACKHINAYKTNAMFKDRFELQETHMIWMGTSQTRCTQVGCLSDSYRANSSAEF